MPIIQLNIPRTNEALTLKWSCIYTVRTSGLPKCYNGGHHSEVADKFKDGVQMDLVIIVHSLFVTKNVINVNYMK